MTTLEIMTKWDPGMCLGGREFAEAHPDPREAIVAALASRPDLGEPCAQWHYVRWACMCILGQDVWAQAQVEAEDNPHKHAELCAEKLTIWLDEQGY